jgi:hypothetical protein
MSEKATQSRPTNACPTPLVLFGIDSRGKPKAARFGKQHAGLALKAATQLQLQVLPGNDPKIADLTTQLPVGRVHATGRTFVPFIRRDLYDQLLAAAANGNAHSTNPPNGSSGASGSTPGGSAPRLPQNWQAIGIGDLVVANQSREDGWYEAIVVEANGDMLTLRLPAGTPDCAPSASAWVALSAATTDSRDCEINESLRPRKARQASRGRSGRQRPVATLGLGRDRYRSSRVGQRRQPMGAWWEAIPVEKAGDLFKLRWREKYAANVPLITRPRLDLALLCPNAA